MLSSTQHSEIVQQCQKYIDIANNFYKPEISFTLPTIAYNVRGTCAGLAKFKIWTVAFNPIIFYHNYEDSLKNTVPHEIAHLIDFSLQAKRPAMIGRKRQSAHGPSWMYVMRVFGVVPKRTHSYDTSMVNVGMVQKFSYTCNCNKSIIVGSNVHNKIQRKLKTYRSKCCKMRIDAMSAFVKL